MNRAELARRSIRVGAAVAVLGGSMYALDGASADTGTEPQAPYVGAPSPDFKPKPYRSATPSISFNEVGGLKSEHPVSREDRQAKIVKLLNMGVPGKAAQEIVKINEKCDGCVYVGYKENGIVEIAATAGPEFKPSIQKLSNLLEGSATVTFYSDSFTRQKYVVANWEILRSQ